MKESKAPAVATYLASHYPCEALPHGALTEVGSIFGVSRERVRQIARDNGFVGYGKQAPEERVRPGRMGRMLCRDCGKPYGTWRGAENRISHNRCPDCRYIEVACAQCGKLKRVRTSDYIVRRSEAYNAHRTEMGHPTYTGRSFCSTFCRGRWMGLNVGFATHPENGFTKEKHAKMSAAKVAQTHQRILASLPGTTKQIIEQSGLARSTVNRYLPSLTAEGLVSYRTLSGKGRPREYYRTESA